MSRRILVAATVASSLAVAACGSGERTAPTAVAPSSAKALVERAAHLKLAAEPVPADAREQGLRASFSNARTAVKDGQVVGLFVVKDADVADKVSDMVRQSAPKSARLIVKRNVMVVYATAGSDRGAAVERALQTL
jgi:hypothetical protein